MRPLGTSLASAHTRTLIRTSAVEVVRLVVRAGQEIPQHASKGEIIVHCLEGRVAFTALGKTQVLEAGKLLDLPASEPHALKGIEDASLSVDNRLSRDSDGRATPSAATTGLRSCSKRSSAAARPARTRPVGGLPRRSESLPAVGCPEDF